MREGGFFERPRRRPRARADRRRTTNARTSASPRRPTSSRAATTSRSSPRPSSPSPTPTTPAPPRYAPPVASATPSGNRAVTALGHLFRYAEFRRRRGLALMPRRRGNPVAVLVCLSHLRRGAARRRLAVGRQQGRRAARRVRQPVATPIQSTVDPGDAAAVACAARRGSCRAASTSRRSRRRCSRCWRRSTTRRAFAVSVDGVPVVAKNETLPVIPAWNMKLIVAAVALEVLGRGLTVSRRRCSVSVDAAGVVQRQPVPRRRRRSGPVHRLVGVERPDDRSRCQRDAASRTLALAVIAQGRATGDRQRGRRRIAIRRRVLRTVVGAGDPRRHSRAARSTRCWSMTRARP